MRAAIPLQHPQGGCLDSRAQEPASRLASNIVPQPAQRQAAMCRLLLQSSRAHLAAIVAVTNDLVKKDGALGVGDNQADGTEERGRGERGRRQHGASTEPGRMQGAKQAGVQGGLMEG